MIFSIMFLCTLSLSAQTPDYDYGEGSGSNIFPLNANSSNKVQWLYVVDDFNVTPPEEGIITKIYIKRSNASVSNSVFQNFTIKIGQVPATMTQFANTTFLTTEMTEVLYSASYIVPSAGADTWVEFALAAPYYYDGESNIVVEMSQSGYANGISVRNLGAGTDDRRIHGSVGSSSGSLASGPADLGLDITPLVLDIGINDVDMEEEFCLGELQDVNLTIENFGDRQVDTFSVGWSINNIVQFPYGFNEALDTVGGANSHTVDVTLEDIPFPAGVSELKFWTFLPNNNDDEDPINDTIEVTIEVLDLDVPSFDSWGAEELSELEFQFSVENPVGVTDYYWDFGDGNNSNLEDPIHTYAEAGTYVVTLELSNNCKEASFDQELVVGEDVNIHELADGNKYLKVYPNPTKDILEVSLDYKEDLITHYKVWDTQGRLVLEENDINQSVIQINVEQLAAGAYFLEVVSNDYSIKQTFLRAK